MRIPKDCNITLGTTEGVGTTNPIIVMTGSFKITTMADCAMMIAAMDSIGSVLADRAPRKKKGKPTAVKAA